MSTQVSRILIASALASGELAEFVAVLRESDLPADDLARDGREFWRFETQAGELVGYGGMERYGTDGLLRSIVLLAAYRGRGLGSAVLAQLMELASEAEVRDFYLLTTTGRAFFERAGFVIIEREFAPASIRASEQMARLCPASAALLVYKGGRGKVGCAGASPR